MMYVADQVGHLVSIKFTVLFELLYLTINHLIIQQFNYLVLLISKICSSLRTSEFFFFFSLTTMVQMVPRSFLVDV